LAAAAAFENPPLKRVFGAQVTPPLMLKVPKYSASSLGMAFVPPTPGTPLSLRQS
jgi:hypothetical protein